ncbi:MAG: hypothetical protein AMXMBFR37_07040 [Steroidobacteraceae bacterium]|jgi:nitrogen regulatory protein P-II 1
MKLIKAFVHHVRSAPVVDALADVGYRNITLQTVTGMLKPLSSNEQAYSSEASGAVISEVRLSLVCEDGEVDEVTTIIRLVGRIGPGVSGWVYVSPVEQALPIGDKEP